MNKQEFVTHAKIKLEDISSDEFDAINMVYAWHPMISDTKGKKEIAALYKKGGMGIINNMLATAHELCAAISKVQENDVAMERLLITQTEATRDLEARHYSERLTITDDTSKANKAIRTIEASFKIHKDPIQNGNY
jgi:hypothetical protein